MQNHCRHQTQRGARAKGSSLLNLCLSVHDKSRLLMPCEQCVKKHEHRAIKQGHIVHGKIAVLAEESQKLLLFWV